jgi:hypothetical protein
MGSPRRTVLRGRECAALPLVRLVGYGAADRSGEVASRVRFYLLPGARHGTMAHEARMPIA